MPDTTRHDCSSAGCTAQPFPPAPAEHRHSCHCGTVWVDATDGCAKPSRARCATCDLERATMCSACATSQMMHRMSGYPQPTHCTPPSSGPTVGQLHRAVADGDRVAERQLDAYFDAHPAY